jgi:hypothetical protein
VTVYRYHWHHLVKSSINIPSLSGLSIFFKCTSTSLFTGSTFLLNLNNFHEYLIQHNQEVLKTILGREKYLAPPLIERPVIMSCSKWTSHHISHIRLHLQCDIAMRNIFSQSQWTMVYTYIRPAGMNLMISWFSHPKGKQITDV